MRAAEDLAEAERLMTICNSCRYCEGLCAVFPAMEMRRSFAAGDLNYLANLCHNCGACYVDCQFSPPHEFDVNVPRTLAKVRGNSYRAYAWPKAFQPLFERNGLVIALLTVIGVAGFILGFVLSHDHGALTARAGQFYALMPHRAMAALFSGAGIYAVLALAMGFRNFWRDIGAAGFSAASGGSWLQGMRDAGELRYLDGGGVGCYNEDDRPTDKRRLFHHLTFYGFLSCFAATVAGTVYHYLLDWPAPYGLMTLPKLFGIPGGVGLVVGSLGLLAARTRRDPAMRDEGRRGMDVAFLAMMLLAGLTGLILMTVRETPAMGVALAVHLGVILALFLTMPYGKFVHGLYRFGALVLYAAERRTGEAASAKPRA